MIRAAALSEMYALAQRRGMVAIRVAGQPSVRSREVAWCVAEALNASFHGQRLTHKDLAALASGVISPATVTRALDRAELRGLVTRRPAPEDARVLLIAPTAAAVDHLLRHAEDGYAELAAAALEAERQLRALRQLAAQGGVAQSHPAGSVAAPSR
ncbi:MarR family transcriptional regulator [Roseomonas sp. AR75]|uniref:MarR family transcriptional regulator n=1 Tax=Roseomonas sp. AR75 TaxID=2562311 RepID=UPI00197D2A3B|nr:MarR family transcriptional regulator [Roseomonas sp. AR75]